MLLESTFELLVCRRKLQILKQREREREREKEREFDLIFETIDLIPFEFCTYLNLLSNQRMIP